jgi:hypothetical protein
MDSTFKKPLDPTKFRDPDWTTNGEQRARVALGKLETLWFNTGTLCNLTCGDRLVYLSRQEVAGYLDEVEREGLGTGLVGFTGGEPFMNREIVAILEETLGRGYQVLVLTNAMRPMMKLADKLLDLRRRFGERLTIRVSLDHHTKALHEAERGPRSWKPALEGLAWLARNGFTLNVAGRLFGGESEPEVRAGFGKLFRELGFDLDAADPWQLVLFPEMDASLDVPEITEACWGILDLSPAGVMCASSRMVVKRKGAAHPVVLACTLLPYDPAFELGRDLSEAMGEVKLNHPHCACFCVLGGAACSG